MYRPNEIEPGPHRPLRVVFVGDRKAEGREDAVTLDVNDVTLEPVLDDLATCVAVAPHELPVGLRVLAS